MKDSSKHVILIKQACSNPLLSKIIFKYACSCECMTYLTYLAITQHLWPYAWTCECVFIAFDKEKKASPNLSMWKANKQTCEIETQAIYMWREEQNRSLTHGTSKVNKTKHKLRFLDNGLRKHIEACVCRIWPAYTCTKHVCVGLLKNPNPKNSKQRNRVNLKL